MKELAVAGAKNTPAAIRALKNTTTRLTKAASEKFLIAFLRLEVELKDLRSSKKSVEELFKLHHHVMKVGKASFGEEWYEGLRGNEITFGSKPPNFNATPRDKKNIISEGLKLRQELH